MIDTTFTVTLGNHEIALTKLPHRANKAWKAELKAQTAPLLPHIATLGGADSVNLTDEQQVRHLFDTLLAMLDDVPGIALNLLQAYAPEQIDDTVADTAYDEEILTAFLTVVRHAIPLDELKAVIGLLSGEMPQATTTTNGPQQNITSIRNGSRKK